MADSETVEKRPETAEEEQALQPEETAADKASAATERTQDEQDAVRERYEAAQASSDAGEPEPGTNFERPVVGDPNNPEAGGDGSHPQADEMNVEALRAGATDARSIEGERLEPYGEGSPAQRDVPPHEVREAEIKEEEKQNGE